MDLRVLGNVEIHTDARVVTLRRAPERCVLATLALSPGRSIHIDTLIEHVWGEHPPANAEVTIGTYVRAVRRTLELAGGQRGWLRNHRPSIYQLTIGSDQIDYHRFTALVATAREKHRAGQSSDAIRAYQQALQLRRAEALANVTGQWAQHRRYALEQEYLDALCALSEEQLAVGDPAAVASNAIHLITEVTPTDRMIILGIHGLARSGRHATIPDFLAQASQRMWEAAEARPSPQVHAVAQELIARPGADLSLPQTATATTPLAATNRVSEAFNHPDRSQPRADDDRGAHLPPGVTITMSATGNGQVYQAGGDQHITGS
jgi:DNA-binding SARP family transcriptional activator